MKRFIILGALLFSTNLVIGQVLKGAVMDALNEPIPNAHITNLSNDIHTHSNEHGDFLLKGVRTGDTLEVSHIAFETNKVLIETISNDILIYLLDKSVNLDEIVILPKLDALNIITDINLKANPVSSSQDILRQVPGLFIGQHAGGGKAEQIFLRGFDIDHGTDIGITVDGMPVNMVSHAHGQGYADLHFLIPETVDDIEFGKGPYYANKGNFNTAGYVNFNTKTKLDASSIKLELGQFNTQRALSMLKLVDTKKKNAYVAAEFLSTDGFFESSQNFNRINFFGKYSEKISNTEKIGLTVSHFTSKWDASGQIPVRAVESGLITRFGAIDDTEGGNTGRTNVLVNYNKFLTHNASLKSSIYYSRYDFELFSNFTFFLEDPVNGDQIRQREVRDIVGFNSEYNRSFDYKGMSGDFQLGMELRNDQINDNELSNTLNRKETLNQIQFGDVGETNVGMYMNMNFTLGNFTFHPGLRFDHFNFQYNDALTPQYQTLAANQSVISPKFNILYNPTSDLQLYLKAGNGFHSNDTRVILAQQVAQSLPTATGVDLGFIWKPTADLLINTSLWHLYLEQEFVYVGDAGIVEPSGETRRLGVEFSTRYQPLDWMYLNLDANYTHARSIEEEEGEDYIPLAPDLTIVSGINIIMDSGLHGGINFRYLKDRPANEDNSIVADGYQIIDLNLGYKFSNLDIGFQIQNLLDTEWNETQFATNSRLFNETAPVEEIHFTPGTPFFLKAFVEYSF